MNSLVSLVLQEKMFKLYDDVKHQSPPALKLTVRVKSIKVR